MTKSKEKKSKKKDEKDKATGEKKLTKCPHCKNHCSLKKPKCSKGKKLAEQMKAAKKSTKKADK